MNLRDWRQQQEMSVEALARQLGLERTPRTLARIEAGEVKADADVVARIVALTGGAVSVEDMHVTRMEWLRANRPERFEQEAASGEAASGTKQQAEKGEALTGIKQQAEKGEALTGKHQAEAAE